VRCLPSGERVGQSIRKAAIILENRLCLALSHCYGLFFFFRVAPGHHLAASCKGHGDADGSVARAAAVLSKWRLLSPQRRWSPGIRASADDRCSDDLYTPIPIARTQ
jgi:hypothetical protein